MFVHLRVHSEFSVSDGVNRIDDLVEHASKSSQPALAVTDQFNLFGAIKFYQSARKMGVKPIVGAEILVQSPLNPSLQSRLLLLVTSHQGYLNLCQLLTLLWEHALPSGPQGVPWSELILHSDGLIALSGFSAGWQGEALLSEDPAHAKAMALELASTFPHRFYLEVQRAGRLSDEALVAANAKLAQELGLPLVATHPVQFGTPEDHEAHEARICIADGEILGNPRRIRRFTSEMYFKTSQEMQQLFEDLPDALDNTVLIAQRCNLTLSLGKPQLPDYPTPLINGSPMPIEEYFRQESHAGLERRLNERFPSVAERDLVRADYHQRLDHEISTIIRMGFPGYFLIVGDFIQWAKNHHCPVGPGRGSGAGSLVAYALGITDLDPIQYNLLFERFLNPERVSMPDFDIDFCQANRDRVIDYVKSKYGSTAVSQIVTFGTMAARAAIRDVGRVLDMSYTFCDGISKLIPNKPGLAMTIAKAMEVEPELKSRYDREDEVRTLIDLAQKLEGLTRNVGMHAGGVLIAPGKLTDFCPLYKQPGSDSVVSQFDKDDVEAAGLVKFDFLGLATLTILEMAKNMITDRHPQGQEFRLENIPLDDPHTYELFAKGMTEAVFQFESRGMQSMLKDAKPSRLEDLIALNALYRPGPMDLIPSFIARKHGREAVTYPHQMVETVLSETYGIMVYQEQVMQTAQVLGGYSLGGADLLRRAMGKKKPEEMAQHREIFRAGALKNGLSVAQADEVFDLMERFAGYGFNKSHAAAYSLLAYQTAWLKVHHTAEFFAANMTVEMDNTDKLKALHDDALRMGISFEPPDVNRCEPGFVPVSNTVIRYGLCAIKGSGAQAIDAVIEERKSAGPFTSLFDFCARVDRTKINKRTIEAMIRAGAFDSLHLNRAALIQSVDLAIAFANQKQSDLNQGGLFDDVGHDESINREPDLPSVAPWSFRTQLEQEKAALGFYFSGHLFDEYEKEVRRFVKLKISDLIESREAVVVAGIASDFKTIQSQRGPMTLFKLDDLSGSMDVVVTDGDAHSRFRADFQEDALLVVKGKVQPDRFSGGYRLNVSEVWSLHRARSAFARRIELSLYDRRPDLSEQIRVVQGAEGDHADEGLAVRCVLNIRDVCVSLDLSSRLPPTDEKIAALQLMCDLEESVDSSQPAIQIIYQ
jgi:DNA polymerase-3 subunit alpha